MNTPTVDQSGAVLVVGGTGGIGWHIAAHYASFDARVIVSSRSAERASEAAARIGRDTIGIALDCLDAASLAAAAESLTGIARLVICAVERDHNSIHEFDPVTSQKVTAIKLVGSLAIINALKSCLIADAAILLFGGAAKDHPHAGSTTMTPICAAIAGMVRTLALELAPMRINALHPGAIGDSSRWKARPVSEIEEFCAQTLTGRLVTMADVVDASHFLLENRSINAVNLTIDGGWLLDTILTA